MSAPPLAGLAIMVKTPAFSPIKTRLARTMGVARAEEIYLKCVERIRAVVLQASRELSLEPYWAVAEKDALTHPLWTDLPTFFQGEGGLGLRLHRVYEALMQRHRFAILIGADSPELDVTHLTQTVCALKGGRSVVGPARDGGFYLFGDALPRDSIFWNTISYSTDQTALDLIAQLHSPEILPVLGDIDTEGDLTAPILSILGVHKIV